MKTTALSMLALAAGASAQTKNIVQLAESVPELRALVAAVTAGGLVNTLEGPGPFTVFAPTDFAFDHLGRNILDFVFNPVNKAELDNVLTYHVAAGKVLSKDLKNGELIPTLDAKETVTVTITGTPAEVFLNTNSRVIVPDQEASNGVVHIIDNVLVPSNFALPKNDILTTALATSSLSTLVTAVKAANITEALAMPNGPYSVFAPTDAAFAKIPANELNYLLTHPDALRAVLFYHLLDHRVYAQEIVNFEQQRTLNGESILFLTNASGAVLINGVSAVIATNVGCTNGVVHLIDTVLIPKAVREAIAAEAEAKVAAEANIVQLAESVPELSTLVKAVVAAGLVNTLESAGPFTVFAPTNDAFNRLPNGVLEYLLANPKELAQVLLYHVAAGNVSSTQLKNDEVITTAQGSNVTVHIYDDRRQTLIFVEDALVIAPNNEASNGVVHLIDQVIFPRAAIAAAAEAATRDRRLRGTN